MCRVARNAILLLIVWPAAQLAAAGDLLSELTEIDALREAAGTDFEKIEKRGAELLAKYPEPIDQGRIYYQLAHEYAQSGLVHPERAIAYAVKALECPLDVQLRLRLHVYWGDAWQVTGRTKAFPAPRKQAASIYLQGLKRALAVELPKRPRPKAYGVFGDIDATQQRKKVLILAENTGADFRDEILEHRRVLLGQIVRLYCRSPYAPAELERLATDILCDAAHVRELIAKLPAAARVEPAARKIVHAPADIVYQEGPPPESGPVHTRGVADPPGAPERAAIGIGEGLKCWVDPNEWKDTDFIIQNGKKREVQDDLAMVIWSATGGAVYPIVSLDAVFSADPASYSGQGALQLRIYDASSRAPMRQVVQTW